MILVGRIIRLGLLAFSVMVLSGIIPISLTHIHSGNACPKFGPIPVCYVVTMGYGAMGVAAALWNWPLNWLFIAGAIPVVLLALSGTLLELAGNPVCPRSDTGWPLCYTSLLAGLSMALAFFFALRIEKSKRADF